MDELDKIEPWIGGILSQLKPAKRKKLSMRIGRLLRARNAKRIRANKTPDGDAMEKRKRKKRIKTKTGKVQNSGRMFREIGKAKSLRINAAPDSVEVGYSGNVGNTAATHHFGESGYVGRTPKGKIIKTKYTPRPLLGFADRDVDEIADDVLEYLDKGL